jgi:hypothetical protein
VLGDVAIRHVLRGINGHQFDVRNCLRAVTVNRPRLKLLFVPTLAIAAGASDPVHAQVQLPTVNLGDTNFEDGFAGPGWFFEEFPDVYSADAIKGPDGKALPGSNRFKVYSANTHIAFVSKKQLLRGWIVFEALQPLGDLHLQLANGPDSQASGFGDLIFGAGLQWGVKKIGKGVFIHRAMLDVSMPTGAYSDARPVNTGNHFVFVNPFYCFTYERNRKVEFSARLHYLWNSTNDDPFLGLDVRNFQPGQAFHVNYAASYEFFDHFRLGFNGYWLHQLTDDRIDGAPVPGSLERTVGLGPGVQIAGKDIWFSVNSYMETAGRNRPSGFKVTFRISKALPSKPS